MAINLNNRAIQDAVQKGNSAEESKNAVADGFSDGMDIDFDDLMSQYNDELNDSGGSSGSDPFGLGSGSSSSGSDPFGLGGNTGGNTGGSGSPFGTLVPPGGSPLPTGSPFGSPELGAGMNSFGLGNTGQQAQPQPKKPGVSEALSDGATAAVKATGGVLVSFTKSIRGITLDDLASLCMDSLILGVILSVIGAILLIIGGINGGAVLKAYGKIFMPTGIWNLALGLIGTALAGFGILSKNEPSSSLNDIDDLAPAIETSSNSSSNSLSVDNDTFDAEYEALMDSFDFDDDDMDMGDDGFEDSSTSASESTDDMSIFDNWKPTETSNDSDEEHTLDNSNVLNNLSGVNVNMDRKWLVRELSSLLPRNCMTYGQTTAVANGSTEFTSIDAGIRDALSRVSKIPLAELTPHVESIDETAFAYIIRMTRLSKTIKLEDFKKEIELTFRSDANDTDVVCMIEEEQGVYKISLTKGKCESVTLKDVLSLSEAEDFFNNKKNLLPLVAGIDTYGEPILADGANYSAMLTCGKQRSGKSWYVSSILLPFMMFNHPKDFQLLIIDPKESSLFTKAFACLPHVVGVHKHDHIIDLLKYILDVEAERRAKLLKEAKNGIGVDNIKAYHKAEKDKNDMPYLYIFIDEFLSVINDAKSAGEDKELSSLIQKVVTKLPYVGIHIWLIAHRATGAVDKGVRANFLFTSCLRSENSIVEETLDMKPWTTPLKNPGDMAVKLQDVGKTSFARAAVIAPDDDELTQVILDTAKAWYKIKPEFATTSYGLLCNKNPEDIKKYLNLDDEQYAVLLKSLTKSQSSLLNRNLESAVLNGSAGFGSEDSFKDKYRQSNNTLSDLLGDDALVDIPRVKPTLISTKDESEQLDDSDEELLAQWRNRQSESSDELDYDDEPIDTSGWDDDTDNWEDS